MPSPPQTTNQLRPRFWKGSCWCFWALTCSVYCNFIQFHLQSAYRKEHYIPIHCCKSWRLDGFYTATRHYRFRLVCCLRQSAMRPYCTSTDRVRCDRNVADVAPVLAWRWNHAVCKAWPTPVTASASTSMAHGSVRYWDLFVVYSSQVGHSAISYLYQLIEWLNA